MEKYIMSLIVNKKQVCLLKNLLDRFSRTALELARNESNPQRRGDLALDCNRTIDILKQVRDFYKQLDRLEKGDEQTEQLPDREDHHNPFSDCSNSRRGHCHDEETTRPDLD